MSSKSQHKCGLCGKKHKRQTLDIMSATWIPKEFCSDFCENVSILNGLAENEKDYAYIECAPGNTQVGVFLNVGGEIVKVEHVFSDGIEISRKMEQPTRGKRMENSELKCSECGRSRSTVNGLCDDCTIKKYGNLNLPTNPMEQPREA